MLKPCNGWKVLGVNSKKKTKSGHVVYKYDVECPRCSKLYIKARCDMLQIKVCRECYLSDVGNIPSSGDVPGWYVRNMKVTARNRKIAFDVDIEYLNELFSKQEKKCALTGLSLEFHGKKGISKAHTTASIDRIDSKLGYVRGNLQWIHKTVNRMKTDLVQADFFRFCLLVSNHLSKGAV